MKLLTAEIKKKLPALRSQESKPADQVPIIVKFFDPMGSWAWYATEGEEQADGDWEFFGLVRGFESELGYFTLSQIVAATPIPRGLGIGRGIERDMYFGDHTLAEVQEKRI